VQTLIGVNDMRKGMQHLEVGGLRVVYATGNPVGRANEMPYPLLISASQGMQRPGKANQQQGQLALLAGRVQRLALLKATDGRAMDTEHIPKLSLSQAQLCSGPQYGLGQYRLGRGSEAFGCMHDVLLFVMHIVVVFVAWCTCADQLPALMAKPFGYRDKPALRNWDKMPA